MLVSIITVVKNGEKSIHLTLDSVKNQDYPHIEHLIIDGKSTDRTGEIVSSYSHVRAIEQPDTGIYQAMNQGLQLAKGEVVGFLNADDYFSEPDVISSLVRRLQEDQTDGVYGDVRFFRSSNGSTTRIWRSGEYKRWKVYFGWQLPHPTFYVHTSFLRQVGEFNPKFNIAADYDLILRCLIGHKMTLSYEKRILVHMTAGGMSNANPRNVALGNWQCFQSWWHNRYGTGMGVWIKMLNKIVQLFLRK